MLKKIKYQLLNEKEMQRYNVLSSLLYTEDKQVLCCMCGSLINKQAICPVCNAVVDNPLEAFGVCECKLPTIKIVGF